MKESVFQSIVIKWLKERKCYVIKNTANPGVPAGCPDIAFFKGSTYGFLEVKPDGDARFQPLQKETIDKINEQGGWARKVYPENWTDIQKELVLLIGD